MQNDRDKDNYGLTIREAAAMAGRSYSWARDRMVDGRIERVPTEGGQALLSTSSVHAAILRDIARSHSRQKRGGHLRLIVDNTK